MNLTKFKIPKIVFSDFDGTLTENGKLGPQFLSVLDLLSKNNIPLVIVSGRSISWGHFFLTHFSNISAAIMEGGGAITYPAGKDFNNIFLPTIAERKKLETFSKKLIKNFSFLKLTADSIGRVTDRAIELSNLSAFLKGKDKNEKLFFKFFDQHKISYSKSNVHLNFWNGEISKALGIELYLKMFHPSIQLSDCLYFGDAPNDQEVFKFLAHTVGVENIKPFLKKMDHHPAIILDKKEIFGVEDYLKKLLKQ